GGGGGEVDGAGRDQDLMKMVVISFTDTGHGVSEENRKKIFDPFFTTKDVGKGTGLGLFISDGIIRAHGGRINLKSEQDEGTTFEVVLEAKV
ncbi:MAG: ATP-binding protein, partial [Thermodesulfobacteriota bacterium]